jgi:sugar phosphate isomerase/epimerase
MLPPDIGLPSDAWYGLQLDAALDRVARYATLAEIASVEDHNLLAARNGRAAVASGLRLTVHGPWDDLEPGSPRVRDRRHALTVHRRHLETAAEIGAETYVVHPDYQGCAVPRDPKVLDARRRTFAELGEYQRELGVRVVVENLPGVGFSHFGGPGDLDLGELGLILDTGHAAICGTLHDFLREPHADLAHVHLHDNRGPADAGDPHLPLGRGVVDARAVLRAARASGATVILELLNEAAIRESIAHLDARGLLDGRQDAPAQPAPAPPAGAPAKRPA